jgi:hypothetical protein
MLESKTTSQEAWARARGGRTSDPLFLHASWIQTGLHARPPGGLHHGIFFGGTGWPQEENKGSVSRSEAGPGIWWSRCLFPSREADTRNAFVRLWTLDTVFPDPWPSRKTTLRWIQSNRNDTAVHGDYHHHLFKCSSFSCTGCTVLKPANPGRQGTDRAANKAVAVTGIRISSAREGKEMNDGHMHPPHLFKGVSKLPPPTLFVFIPSIPALLPAENHAGKEGHRICSGGSLHRRENRMFYLYTYLGDIIVFLET